MLTTQNSRTFSRVRVVEQAMRHRRRASGPVKAVTAVRVMFFMVVIVMVVVVTVAVVTVVIVAVVIVAGVVVLS